MKERKIWCRLSVCTICMSNEEIKQHILWCLLWFLPYIETKNVPLVYLMTHFGLFLTCDKQKKTTHIEYHVSFIKGYCRYSTSWTESGNNTICKVFLSFKHKYISNNIFEWTYFSSKSIHLTQKLAYPHNWFWYNNEL